MIWSVYFFQHALLVFLKYSADGRVQTECVPQGLGQNMSEK